MSIEQNVQLFVVEQYYPCGQQSSCCGPIGLTEEEIAAYRDALTDACGRAVEVIHMRDEPRMAEFPDIADLTRRYGLKSIPTVVVAGEVVSLGPPTPAAAASDLQDWMGAQVVKQS